MEVAELVTRPKAVSLRATGLLVGDAILRDVAVKLGVTQAIVLRWQKLFFQGEALAKRD